LRFHTRLIAVALAALLSPWAGGARADFPEKPIRLIVPFPAGGTVDLVARLVTARMADDLKASFVIENRGGAGGVIATDAAAKAAPDGYTLLLTSPNHQGQPGQAELCLRRQRPLPHVTMELLLRRTGVAVAHIPYRGAAPAPATAWDYPGHRIVGAIADVVLTRDYPQTRDKVAALLTVKGSDGKDVARSLREVAVFADCAKNEPTYCKREATREEIDYVLRNLLHKSFHFTNSPLAQKTYLAGGVGTGETDVVQMIGYAIAKLQDKHPRKHDVDLTKTEALWLLAHLIGDIPAAARRAALFRHDLREDDQPECLQDDRGGSDLRRQFDQADQSADPESASVLGRDGGRGRHEGGRTRRERAGLRR
jgi:hypothetical protein